ncbi:MAG: arylsulfatase [Bacteroidota bacterium]
MKVFRLTKGINKQSFLTITLLVLLIPGLISCVGERADKGQEDLRPNILLIVADDLGYADLGCYGGDIHTPNIDGLAKSGISFSRFHTAPMCAPSRAMLLSGNDNHIAGIGKQGFQSGEFGYEGRLTDRIVPVPALLRDAGYHTYMAGKWHLGEKPESNPAQKGFEHSFVLLNGAGNHYNDQGLFKENPKSPYTEDGKAATWKDGVYSTDFYTNKLIEYIDQNKADNKPFFAFAAYTSPHWPLQVDDRYWRKYEGRYDDGYEKLKEKRFESLIKAGMISGKAELPPNHGIVLPWESLSDEERKKESRKMELYAGMVDNLDFNIGRLLNYLKDIGEYDNTLIVFISDNGAAGNDFYHHPTYAPFIRKHFNEDFESMGKANSFISYGPQWAEAGSSPFLLYKGFATEGGMLAPMIVSGPGVSLKNDISHGFLSVMDLAPTFYEVAGASYPEKYKGKEVYPLKGQSLLPFLSGRSGSIHSADYVFAMEHYGHAMLRKGDWKITNIKTPLLEENFMLFNVSEDLAEIHDLKTIEPEKYEELLGEWRKYSSEISLQLP